MITLKQLNNDGQATVQQFADYKAMSAFVKQYGVSPTAVYNTGRKTTDPRYVAPIAPHYFERLTKKRAATFAPKPTAEVVNEPSEVTYATILESRDYHTDKACCSVVSMATALNIPFVEAQAFLAKRGRKTNKGASMTMIRMAYKDAGKLMRSEHQDYMVKPSSQLKTIAQTCREYSKGTWVLLVSGHILTIKNGQPQDWTKATSRHRVKAVWHIADC